MKKKYNLHIFSNENKSTRLEGTLQFSKNPDMAEVVGETSGGGVSLATNMADMTKIRTQLERKEYTEERNMWSEKV